jgi:hypothetical protein
MLRCDASANMVVYLKAVDRHRHIKAFIVRCDASANMGVYLKAVDRQDFDQGFHCSL